MVRRLGKIALYSGLALLGVLVLLYITLLNPPYEALRNALLPRLTRLAGSALNGSLEIGALRGSLLSAPALHHVLLRDARGTIVGYIESIRLAYDLTTLFKGRLDIHAVEIVRPQVTVVQQPDGQLNLQTLLPASQTPAPQRPAASGGLPIAIRLDTLQIQDGMMTLDLPSLPGVRQVTNLQMRLSARLDQTGLRAQMHQFTANAMPADVTLQALQGAFLMHEGVMRVEDFRLQTGATLVTAHGTLPGGSVPADFALQVQPLALADIGRVLQNELLRDPVQLTLTAAGPPAALQVRGQLSTPAARVALEGQADTAARPLRYNARVDVAHLDLSALVGRADLQSDINLALHAQGQGVAPHELQSTLRVDIQPSHLGPLRLRPSAIHLEAVQQRLHVQRLDLDTSAARLTASGALDLGGTSDLRYDLMAHLAGLQQLAGTPELAGEIHLQGQAQGTWPALGVQGTLEASALRYQGHALQDLQLTYEGTQLGTQPQVTAQLLAQQARVGTLPVERVTLQAAYQGSTRQAEFAIDVKQAASTGGAARGLVHLGDTEHQVVLEELLVHLPNRPWRTTAPWQVVVGPQRLALGQLQLAHADESIILSGGLAGDLLQDIQLHIAQLDLSYLQQLLHLPTTVGGRANADVQLAGTLAEPRLQSEWTLRAPTQPALPFSSLRSTLTYARQRLQGTLQVQQGGRDVLDLDLHLPFDLALTGLPLGQRLLDAPVAMRLALKQPDLAAIQHAQPTLPPLHGTLQGSAALQGTYAALTFDASMQLQQLGVVGSVEQLRGPMRLTGALVNAPSVAELARALQQGQIAPHLQHVTFSMPTLQGVLPSQGGSPAQPFQVHDVELQANAQWTPQGLYATLQRLSLQTTGFGLPRTAVALEAQVAPQRLTLSRLHVRLPQSELQAQGFLTLPDQQMQWRCDIPRLRLDELPLSLPAHLPPLLQGTVTARGSVQAPQVEADLQYAGGRLRAELTGHLQEPLPRYQATLRLENLDVAQLLPKGQGRLQAGVRLQGVGFTGDKRQASMEMTVDTTGLNLAPGLTARLQANLSGDTLQVSRLQVRSTPIELTAGGTLSASKQTAFDYRLNFGDLRPLGAYLGMELQAKGGLSGKVQGNHGVLQTQGTLQSTDWGLATMQIPRLSADFSATQLLTDPHATLKAQATDLQGPSLPPTSLRLDIARTPQQGHFTLAVTKGPYDKSTVAGTLIPSTPSQRLTLNTVRLHHQQLAWENVQPVEIVMSGQGQVQIKPLTLRSGTQELTMQGALVPNGAIQADLQIRQLQIRPTVQVINPTANVPDGRLNLSAVARGTTQQPEIQADLQVSALQWQQHKLGDIRATLSQRGTGVRTDVRWQEQERQLLRLHGSLGLGSAEALDLRIEASEFDLARLTALAPEVKQSAGTLSLDLHVTGTPQKPQIRGPLTVRDGTLQLAATGELYKDIQARLDFTNNRLDIPQCQIGSRGGPLQLSGHVDYTDLTLRALDLTVRAQNFTAIRTPAIEAVISADLRARGPQDALDLTGTITVPRARLVTKNLPGGGPKAVEPWELTVPGVYGHGGRDAVVADGKAAAQPGAAAILDALRADLRLDIPRNTWVQGPGTAVEMRGDIHVTKARKGPFILSGPVETVRGFASFYGKKFDIAQGQVTFTGSPEPNPQLDVTVTRKVSDYVITIHAGGKAQQPEIRMSSVPVLDQADILSLLVAGKTTDKLTSSEQGSLSKQAQQIAGGVVASQVGEALGETLGLDTVELTTESAKVGRYVTQDLFLSYERGLGGKDNGNTVGAEYSLSRRMKLKGTSSDTGETALDLFWRLDFK